MNKYLSFIFASVLTLTGVQLSKASNPSDSLAIVSAKWERTSSLQGIQLKQASIEGLFGGKQSISILTIGRAEGYTAFIATTDSLTTTSQLAEQSRSSAAINGIKNSQMSQNVQNLLETILLQNLIYDPWRIIQ